ncbi:TPA: hypothetical protein ACH3X3_010803 [Trebouxia sp. C0006]
MLGYPVQALLGWARQLAWGAHVPKLDQGLSLSTYKAGALSADSKHLANFIPERRSKSPGRSDSAPEVGQGVLLGEDGQSRDLAFLASGPEHHSFEAKATVLMLPLLSYTMGACMRLALWRFASASMFGKTTFCLAATTGKVLPEADATIQSSLQEAFNWPVRDLVVCLWLS